ncbi:MAG: hypothetical protein ACO32Z_05785 [Gemmatimonadaceae bacterium]
MPPLLPTFSPTRAGFACPALLAAAARAPIGGERETLLGVLMAARLVAGLCPDQGLAAGTRGARAEAARGWLTSVTLAAKIRTAVLRCIASSEGQSPQGAAEALVALLELVPTPMDRSARREVSRLIEALQGAPVVLLAPPRAP